MKVLYSWLREFCPVELPPEELAEILTRQGVHVEEILRPWERLVGVVVARVLEVRDHPGSDTLCLARVSFGSGERELVVGVRNMKEGDLVPLAGPGAAVPAKPEPLSARSIRGVVSDGMLCSPQELGISADHRGILILPEDTPVGVDFRSHFGLDDVVFDVEVEANRPDLMSVAGVAREAAAATEQPFMVPDVVIDENVERAEEAATVEVVDHERCPRYLARVVKGVTVGASPLTVQARLTASGMRPLSNVVDATNYALLELGHPLHPFDLDLLSGAGIVVRRAVEGERLVTLDDVERELTEEDLVIADHARGVAIAGIMGSASAEVAAETRDVLLESAYFERTGILRTAQRLGLSTEASMRFERGADPEAVPRAAARAAQLIAAWSGGTVLAGEVDAGKAPERRRLAIRPSRTSLLLGFEVTGQEVRESLGRLRIEAEEGGEDTVWAEIPGHRVDIEREVDLIEEVARIRGYERFGSTLPRPSQPGGFQASYAFRRRVRSSLARAGLRETSSLSFVGAADLALTGDHEAVRVANPLAADQAFLRTSLLPGLLAALARNVARQVRSVALFEVGRVFYPGQEPDVPVEEHERVALAMTGPAGRGYPDGPREFDFFDAKGALEALMESLGIGEWEVGAPPSRHLFHPSRSASVTVGGELAGEVGEVSPAVAARLDVPGRVAVAELEVAVLARCAAGPVVARDVPRLPAVHRDLAFIVDAVTPAGAVGRAIEAAAGDLAESVTLFDVFTGPPVPEGRKSLAFSVDFRAPDRTLTDEEADQAVKAIVARVAEEFGGQLRSG